jgi:hypothetical protein
VGIQANGLGNTITVSSSGIGTVADAAGVLRITF